MRKSVGLPPLRIGELEINPPVIQGGMGVLVSSSRLAAAVSTEGALGVLAAVGAGEEGELGKRAYKERSSLGLRELLRRTRENTSNPFGVNIMCALSNYPELVAAAEQENAAAVISGAGLPLKLPGLVSSTRMKLIPVVSSARAAGLICRTWWKRYRRLPDALIVEGHSAGGHLGFSLDELASPVTLESLVADVLEVCADYRRECGIEIPVIAAGGIFDGGDIARFLRLGASGVQMGTRFVCTHECDAHIAYKQAYVNCRKEDIIIIRSPVKLPLRVINNPFVERLSSGGRAKFSCRYHCLSNCDPASSPYCIAKALKNATEGHLEEGFVTCGSNAWRIDKIVSVRELLEELSSECRLALSENPLSPRKADS